MPQRLNALPKVTRLDRGRGATTAQISQFFAEGEQIFRGPKILYCFHIAVIVVHYTELSF